MFGLSRLYASLAAAGALLAAVLAGWAYVGHLKREATQARSEAAQAIAAAAVSQGQAGAASDAAAITDTRITREHTIERTHEITRDRLVTAPGANAPLDRELVRRARIGLCQQPVYIGDLECASLRAIDPAEPSGAGSPRPPPG